HDDGARQCPLSGVKRRSVISTELSLTNKKVGNLLALNLIQGDVNHGGPANALGRARGGFYVYSPVRGDGRHLPLLYWCISTEHRKADRSADRPHRLHRRPDRHRGRAAGT